MAAGDTDIGTGTQLSFSGFTMELLSVSWSGISRETVNSSHMATTTAHTFLVGDLYDPGEISAEVHLDTTASMESCLTASAQVLTIKFLGDTSDTWSCNAFMTGFEMNVPLEDKMTGSATFKATGAITF